MKKLIALGLAACMTFSLAGCSGSASKETEAASAAETTAAASTEAETSAVASDTATSIDKLTVTYVTSPLNVPTIIEKDQGIFEKELGVPVEYAELTSGADQTQALASGDVQVLYAVGATSVILSAANGADIKVLNMYSRSPKAFCMYSKDETLTTPENLKGKKIATNATNAFIPWYEAQGAEIVGVDTSSEAIDLVLSGRADFLGTSVPVLNAYLDEHPDAKDKLKEAFVIPDSEDVIAIPVRKGETEYLDVINAALAELREEGKLKEISEKYLGGDYTESAYQ